MATHCEPVLKGRPKEIVIKAESFSDVVVCVEKGLFRGWQKGTTNIVGFLSVFDRIAECPHGPKIRNILDATTTKVNV